jgi:hypothetical protein
MSEQVLIDLDLLEEIADSLDYEVRDVRNKVRALLASTRAPSQPVSAQPDDDNDYMPAGIIEGIMRSSTVDAVSMAAQSLRAQKQRQPCKMLKNPPGSKRT